MSDRARSQHCATGCTVRWQTAAERSKQLLGLHFCYDFALSGEIFLGKAFLPSIQGCRGGESGAVVTVYDPVTTVRRTTVLLQYYCTVVLQ